MIILLIEVSILLRKKTNIKYSYKIGFRFFDIWYKRMLRDRQGNIKLTIERKFFNTKIKSGKNLVAEIKESWYDPGQIIIYNLELMELGVLIYSLNYSVQNYDGFD